MFDFINCDKNIPIVACCRTTKKGKTFYSVLLHLFYYYIFPIIFHFIGITTHAVMLAYIGFSRGRQLSYERTVYMRLEPTTG